MRRKRMTELEINAEKTRRRREETKTDQMRESVKADRAMTQRERSNEPRK